MRLVENHEWAAVLLSQDCVVLMSESWFAVLFGNQRKLLKAAIASDQ